MMNKYFKMKKMPNTKELNKDQKPKPVKEKRNPKSISPNQGSLIKSISHMVSKNLVTCLILMFLFLPACASSSSIKSPIYFCEQNDIFSYPLLNVDRGCEEYYLSSKTNNENKILNVKNKDKFTGYLLRKEEFEIKGRVHFCQRKKVKMSTYEGFFGANWKTVTEENEWLTREECELMKATKKCGDKQMICDEEGKNNIACFYSPELIEEYKWLSNEIKEETSCKVESYLIALHGSELVLNRCNISELQCRHKDGIMIWAKEVYSQCLYKTLGRFELVSEGEDIVRLVGSGHLFKIVEKVVDVENCAVDKVYKTAEGLYLELDDSFKQVVDDENVEISELNQLILSELDGYKYENYNQQQQIKLKNCLAYKAALESTRYLDDHYEVVENPALNFSVIIYSKFNLLWLPKCVRINEFELDLNRDDKCYEDLKIKINITNENTTNTISGFLTISNIFKMNSKTINCSITIVRHFYNTFNNSYCLLLKNNTIQRRRVKLAKLFSLENEQFKINFPHYRELLTDKEIIRSVINNKIAEEFKTNKF